MVVAGSACFAMQAASAQSSLSRVRGSERVLLALKVLRRGGCWRLFVNAARVRALSPVFGICDLCFSI